MRYLLDTGSISDWIYHRGATREHFRTAFQAGHKIGIGTPVLGELWSGIQLSVTREANEPKLVRALADLTIWPYDNAAAQQFGRVFAELQRRGAMMQQIDIQIAAIAFSLGNCVVVSKDNDFHRIKGLLVEDWTT